MPRVLLGLIISYGLVVGGAGIAGLLVDDERSFALHFALGLFATLFTCLLYCVVLTYFIITGKLVKTAVLKGQLDAVYIPRTQGFKGKVSALIALAVASTLGAALIGVLGHDPGATYGEQGRVHMLAECAAVAFNVLAFYLIWQIVHANSTLVSEVFEHLGQQAGRQGK